MGLCVSMLRRVGKKRQPEQRRGMPKALYVVRSDRRPSRPEAAVFQTHSSGPSGLDKPGKGDSRKHEKWGYDCTGELGRRFCTAKPRLPCGSTWNHAVEPVALSPEGRSPMFRGATTTNRSTAEGCRTPMTPRRTPVWQRRILMGTRCELPRFSGLILYDEHGRPLQSSTHNRADHLISRGRNKTARKTTTLRDLL